MYHIILTVADEHRFYLEEVIPCAIVSIKPDSPGSGLYLVKLRTLHNGHSYAEGSDLTIGAKQVYSQDMGEPCQTVHDRIMRGELREYFTKE